MVNRSSFAAGAAASFFDFGSNFGDLDLDLFLEGGGDLSSSLRLRDFDSDDFFGDLDLDLRESSPPLLLFDFGDLDRDLLLADESLLFFDLDFDSDLGDLVGEESLRFFDFLLLDSDFGEDSSGDTSLSFLFFDFDSDSGIVVV